MRLAAALGTAPRALLPDQDSAPEPSADDARVEAALTTVGQGLSAKDLAVALQWQLPRAKAALDQLGERLAPTGQRLHRFRERYRIVAADDKLTAEERQALDRRRVATNRLTQAEARTLYALIRGRITARWLADTTPTKHTTAYRMLRLGYAEQADGGLRPSEAVEMSLGLRR
ncbi:MAG: hypothetical protein U0R70_11120 [Solirubrobacteraceae bacterium]